MRKLYIKLFTSVLKLKYYIWNSHFAFLMRIIWVQLTQAYLNNYATCVTFTKQYKEIRSSKRRSYNTSYIFAFVYSFRKT